MKTLKILKELEQSATRILDRTDEGDIRAIRHDIANLVSMVGAARRLHERDMLAGGLIDLQENLGQYRSLDATTTSQQLTTTRE
ncbi:MAG: hypothetical protein CML31_14725 [Rhizobiales bacterium]|nr:hypothetical protein [Hyphomicrobiales bacterium]|tara:strand:- start:6913 stop:7164 length:252 start_codon:yes stop_codon:yes gene_type:complete